MEILEAYDLTGTLPGAAALAGCNHKAVARLVAARDAEGGGLPVRARRRPMVDPISPATWEKRWPPVGTFDGHQRGE